MSLDRIKALTAECPECESVTTFKSTPKLSQKVACASCGARLEVAFLNPIMLDWIDEDAPAYSGDYDDRDYDSEYG